MDFFHEYLFPPHPHNQFVLSTPTYLRLRCYSRPVSHQHYRLFQHRIPRRLREPVCLVAAPSHTSDSSGRRPAVSVCHGKGGWFCYLVPLVHLQLRRPAVSIRPGGEGGVLIPVPPCSPQTFLSISVFVGMYCFVTRNPLCTFNSVVVSVLPVKSNSPCRSQPKCPS